MNLNSLLKRQIRKYLKAKKPDHDAFIDAVNDSYNEYEEQLSMLQRAIKVSSDELFEANVKLREEARSLKEINRNLETVLNSLNPDGNDTDIKGFTTADYIKQQAEEIIEINLQRQKLVENLELQNEELNEYAHVVSHDLKSPLRNVNTLITWVLEDRGVVLTEESKKSLDLVLQNVEKMDLTIKGILDYSSIDKLELEDRIVDFNKLVHEIMRTNFTSEHIEYTIVNKLPNLKGNYFRFKQLFYSIIDNAVKYNDKEKCKLQIGCNYKGRKIEFFIKDNGVGINNAYLEKIFNVFTKLDSDNPSSGMGLSIAKKIVSYYGGTIWVKSIPGKGATFIFTLQENGTA